MLVHTPSWRSVERRSLMLVHRAMDLGRGCNLVSALQSYRHFITGNTNHNITRVSESAGNDWRGVNTEALFWFGVPTI